jgi:hypothetical protein
VEYVRYFSEISPTFLGIVVGSLFTIIGVILTNSSNTKRLRIQHDHERLLDSKERDATMRRETYLGAIEAISAGMVAVGRFGEFHFSPQELMEAYTNKSPAIAKVMVVGRNDTVKAVANFNSELTGAFMRLTSKRQNQQMILERSTSLEQDIERAIDELKQLQSLIDEHQLEGNLHETQVDLLKHRYAAKKQNIDQLKAEHEKLWNLLLPEQMNLVKQSLQEIARLDQLLTPVIGMMRAELELPFDEQQYNQMVTENHHKQRAFLDAFIQEQAVEMQETVGASPPSA